MFMQVQQLAVKMAAVQGKCPLDKFVKLAITWVFDHMEAWRSIAGMVNL